jgi:hypothetical protein
MADTTGAATTGQQDSATSDKTSGPPPPKDLFDLSPDQIKAVADAQRLPYGDNVEDRKLVFRQLHVALALILGGAIIATVGVVAVRERDATKLTAIISIGTAVIAAGAALLPTGAAAGAAARILSRPVMEDQTKGTGLTAVVTGTRNGGRRNGSG